MYMFFFPSAEVAERPPWCKHWIVSSSFYALRSGVGRVIIYQWMILIVCVCVCVCVCVSMCVWLYFASQSPTIYISLCYRKRPSIPTLEGRIRIAFGKLSKSRNIYTQEDLRKGSGEISCVCIYVCIIFGELEESSICGICACMHSRWLSLE